jgi:hypothetical protein
MAAQHGMQPTRFAGACGRLMPTLGLHKLNNEISPAFCRSPPGCEYVGIGGQTDVVMKLFGPDSQTSLIAEDDDGGVGLNARIVADIIPGQYFVPIRHFNKARGTGSYSIRVSR